MDFSEPFYLSRLSVPSRGGPDRVGLGWVGSGRVGSGRVGPGQASGRLGFGSGQAGRPPTRAVRPSRDGVQPPGMVHGAHRSDGSLTAEFTAPARRPLPGIRPSLGRTRRHLPRPAEKCISSLGRDGWEG